MFSSGNIAPDYFGGYAFFNRIACDYYFFDCLVAGDFVHYVQHNLFQNRAESPRAGFERNGFFRDRRKRAVVKHEIHSVEFQHFLILFDKGVFRLGQDFDECGFVQLVNRNDNGKPADEFRNKTEFDKVVGLDFPDDFAVFFCPCLHSARS